MKALWTSVSLGFALLGAGCSDSEKAASVPLEELPDRLVVVYCQALEECLGTAAEQFLGGADCEDRLSKQVEDGEIALIEDAVERGDATYDGEKAAQCLDDLGALSCESFFLTRVSTVCKEALHGSVEVGDACTQDAECDVGLFCKTDGACPGACSELLGNGAACTSNDDCEDGLICSEDTRECVAPADVGEPCNAGEPPCRPYHACQGATATSPGTCVTIDEMYSGEDGDPCNFEEPSLCKSGLTCALLVPDMPGVCEPQPTGEICHLAAPEQCPAGQFCFVTPTAEGNLEGTCQDSPGDGMPCAGRFEGDPMPTVCDTDRICSGGTCYAVGRLGDACPTDDACYSGFCVEGVCAPGLCAE